MRRNFFISLILLSCCSQQDDKNVKRFTRDDFTKVTSLKVSQETLPPGMSNPAILRVVRDTILISQDYPGQSEEFNFVDLYNLKNGKLIGKFLPRGRGPGECLACDITEVNDVEMVVLDVVSRRVSIYNLDSMINRGSNYKPKQVKIPAFTDFIVRYDEQNFIATDSRYLRDSKYRNDSISRLFKFPINGLDDEELDHFMKRNVKHFVSNVSQATIITNKEKGVTFVLDKAHDEIEKYDENFQLVNVLKGPDEFDIEYKVEEGRGVLTKRPFISYYHAAKAKDFFYAVYAGRNGVQEDFRSPVEILKINWNGELLDIYKLDAFIFCLSINPISDKSYAVGFDPKAGASFYSVKLD